MCGPDTRTDSLPGLLRRCLVPREQTRAPDCQADWVDVRAPPGFRTPVQCVRVCLDGADDVTFLNVVADSDRGSDG